MIADKITIWLVHNDVISEKDKDIYVYAIECLLLTIIPIIPVLVFGFFGGNIKGCMILMLTFFIIRKFCGGYHMDNPYMCAISSAITIIGVVYIGRGNSIKMGYIYALIAAYLSLFINKPVDSDNRRLDSNEKAWCKRITILLCMVTVVVIVLLYVIGAYSECKYVMLGVIMAAILQMMGVVKNHKTSVANHEGT